MVGDVAAAVGAVELGSDGLKAIVVGQQVAEVAAFAQRIHVRVLDKQQGVVRRNTLFFR